MKYEINENELQILLEAGKLVHLEKIVLLEDDNTDIPEKVIVEVSKSIQEKILYLLRSDSSTNSKAIFEEYVKGRLTSARFLKIYTSILLSYSLMVGEEGVAEKARLAVEAPKPILRIMQDLAAYGNRLSDLLGSNFYNQYFLSQFLIYKINEDRFEIDSKKINKTELYNLVYGGASGKNLEILGKMTDVQNAHKTLFKSDSSTISLDTAKKRMQQVLPSKHKEGTMNQSEELNIFQQHALLGVFLIYKTSYQRFLSNTTTQSVPDIGTFEEAKAAIEEFYQKHPISGVDDALFLKTVSEDTYHFALFNAVTRLTTAVLSEMNEIVLAAGKYDSLSMLFIIDQLIETIPAYTSEWLGKYQEIVAEIDKFSKFPEIQQAVLDAVEDEESLNYAKQTMLDMFSKFDKLEKNSENYDFVEEVFKKIVKDYYNNDSEEKNAYVK